MTDEQIIKEYQDFVNSVKQGGKGEIAQGRFGDILDIINRQKAENEELKVENQILKQKRANIFEQIEGFERGKIKGIQEFAERLKEEMRLDDDCDYDCINCHYECKEYIPYIDNLVEEMTEVQE